MPLAQKRSNIQFGIEVRFAYQGGAMRSAASEDLFARSWIGCRPLLDFVEGD